jgi:rRNA maturation endonuclease Nob1
MSDFEFERSIVHLPEEEQVEKKKEDAKKTPKNLSGTGKSCSGALRPYRLAKMKREGKRSTRSSLMK